MKLYGLTGGIGAGKSTAADFLARHGVPVIDTDQVARDVVAPGEPALDEVRRVFGPEVFDAKGALDRRALAQVVFGDAAKRQQLEAILHPRIRERWLAQVATWRAGGAAMAVVVIPLLFETGAESHFDAVVCTACSAASQRERLKARGWSEAEIANRLAAQWPMEKKISAATYVVWTEGTLETTQRQLACIFGL